MTTATKQQLPTGTWNADATHSQVGFAVDYMGGTFRGFFSPVEATLEVAEDGSVELKGSAQASAIHVLDENLAGHLLAPDWFDAERTPGISFSATDVTLDGGNVVVSGELTIKNVTKPVELKGTIAEPIADPYGNSRIGVTLTTTIDRTQFDLNWNNPLPSGEPALSNDVTLTAELFLVQAQA
jgi:polyisoprenoid-binding protein YceI